MRKRVNLVVSLSMALLLMLGISQVEAKPVIKSVEGKYVLVDSETGKQITAKGYKYITLFFNDPQVARAQTDSGWVLLDTSTGNELTIVYENIGTGFNCGVISVTKGGGKSGYVDKRGQVVVPLEYTNPGNFSNGVARVKKNEQWGYIDLAGKWYDTQPSADKLPMKEYVAKSNDTPVSSKAVTQTQKTAVVESKTEPEKRSQTTKAETTQQKRTTANSTTLTNTSSVSTPPAKVESAPAPLALATEETESEQQTPPRVGANPYLTDSTQYIKVSTLNTNTVSDVHDGVFSIREGNKFSFWRVDGGCLYRSEWESSESGYLKYPYFSSGVAVVKKGDNLVLLYKNNRAKELKANWKSSTQFQDGLALVETTETLENSLKKIYIYINTEGNRVFPHLDIAGKADHAMRPLRCGLRAVPVNDEATYSQKWGFINEQGEVVIAPQYAAACDFSNGYAWVNLNDENVLIDKTGRVVFKSTDKTTPRGLYLAQSLGDVDSERFYVKENDKVVYYDLTGKVLASYPQGSAFYKGYAFVNKSSDIYLENKLAMIDADFKEVKAMSDKVLSAAQVSICGPKFGPYDVACYKLEQSVALYYEGTPVVWGWRDKESANRIDVFKGFSVDGYTVVDDVFLAGKSYKGIMKSTGEMVYLIGTEEKYSGGKIGPEEPREPRIPPVPPTPPYPPLPPEPVEPGNPGGPVLEKSKYKVTVTIEGEGTASVSPDKEFLSGETTVLSATPAEGWALVEVSDNIVPGEKIEVKYDMNIKVTFRKKMEIDPVPFSGTYQGVTYIEELSEDDDRVVIYGEVSQNLDISSPYGANTYGYLALMFDPDKRYKNKDNNVAFNAFCAPLKIMGYQRDEATGREWLIADGGSFVVGNMTIVDNSLGGDLGALNGALMKMMLVFDGEGSPTAIARRYRIEILDRDKATGEFTFGYIDAYSLTNGWVPGGSEVLVKQTSGFFSTKRDCGMDANYFKGARMKVVQKRNDVQWYPSESWYNNDGPMHERIIKEMGEKYRTFVSDYEVVYGNQPYK